MTERANPIADLSYRGYDGPLQTRLLRWWTVALANIRITMRRVPFWVLAALSSGGYLFVLVVFFIRSMMAPPGTPVNQMLGLKWAEYFMFGLPSSLFYLFLIALLVGAGSIAADNRANALLVYLSKPLTRADYLVGKWVGVFVPLFLVAVTPPLVLYLYCAASFRAEGFFSEDPWLIARLLGTSAIAAAVNTSLIIGFSAWSKSSSQAGGFYAGLYFLSILLASTTLWMMGQSRRDLRAGNVPAQVATVNALSVPGIIQGLARHVYDASIPSFEILFRGRRGDRDREWPAPELWVLAVAAGGLVVAGPLLARTKVRAVEVVRG